MSSRCCAGGRNRVTLVYIWIFPSKTKDQAFFLVFVRNEIEFLNPVTQKLRMEFCCMLRIIHKRFYHRDTFTHSKCNNFTYVKKLSKYMPDVRRYWNSFTSPKKIFQITILSRKFKFPAHNKLFKLSALDSYLEYLFWRSKNPQVSSEIIPPLATRFYVTKSRKHCTIISR